MIIFDLDGTLALIEHRRHFVEGDKKDWAAFFKACADDRPNRAIIAIFKALVNSGNAVEIWSGRSDEVREETMFWLNKYIGIDHIRFTDLIMRKAGDHQPDVQLKQGWLDAAKDIEYVFDDRASVVDMWRSNGITCLQVAPGNF